MRSKLNWVLIPLLVVVLGGVGWAVYQQYFAAPVTREAPIPERQFTSQSPDAYKKGQDLVPEPWSVDEGMGTQVLVKSVHLQAPLVEKGAVDIRGVSNLDLPAPPLAALYKNTSPIGAKSGTTLIASHVDDGQGYTTPFSNMHKVEKGTPVMVKDDKGEEFYYRITDLKVYERTGIPDEYFSKKGKPRLVLVTCSGPTVFSGDQAFYLYNLVAVAEPLDEKPSDW